jgi:hypothetical protein
MKIFSDFFKHIIELLEVQYKNTSNNKEKEEVLTSKNAYEWFLKESTDKNSKRVEENKDAYLLPGKIYIFKYNAKYKNELDYWDRHPILLVIGNVIGESGKLILGLNISWYPPPARKYIVEKIREIYNSRYKDAMIKSGFKANEQGPVYLDIYNLKILLDTYGLSFALRTYIPSNIIAPKYCVCYEDWDKAILLDQPKIFPELQINNPYYSLQNIYEQFKIYVRNSNQNRSEAKRKMNEAKKKGRYNILK